MSARMSDSISYNLEERRPKVLLLGNGVVYDKDYCWEKIIERIKRHEINSADFKNKNNQYEAPYSILVSAMASEDDNERRNAYINELTHRPAKTNDPEEIREKRTMKEYVQIKELLKLPFDVILTTNYTYEIEFAQNPNYPNLSDSRKRDYSVYYTGHDAGQNKSKALRDGKYLLHTCNKVAKDAKEVWHVHGELRRPSSIILTHDEYAHQAYEILRHNTIRSGHYSRFINEFHVSSWIDYFFIGDVYILGLSLDYSEFDLWWLLARRMREMPGIFGNVVYYDRYTDEKKCKFAALKAHHVDVRTLDYHDDNYTGFYEAAIRDMKEALKKGDHQTKKEQSNE